MKKIVMLVTAVFATLGLVVTTGGPANAAPNPPARWSYCTNNEASQTVVGYLGQGYCPTRWTFYDVNPLYYCLSFENRAYNNSFGAVSNRFNNRNVIFYSNYDCTGDRKQLNPNTSDPDLFNDAMYHTISSLKYTPA